MEHSSQVGQESLRTYENISVLSLLSGSSSSSIPPLLFFAVYGPFPPFVFPFGFPSWSSVSVAVCGSPGLCSPCWRPSGSQRVTKLHLKISLLSLLAPSSTTEFLPHSVLKDHNSSSRQLLK